VAARSGKSGGSLALRGGIAVSTERMNRILEVSPGDLVARVQPGVILAALQAEVERHGLFYPPDPNSLETCTIGGNVAENGGLLVGAIGLRPLRGERENIGYWIGRPYWGRGYATAAAQAVIALGFELLGLEALSASHLARNAASGRVMDKCGMRLLRQERRDHRGRPEDFCVRGITREEWASALAG
jgi:hypothetical protein